MAVVPVRRREGRSFRVGLVGRGEQDGCCGVPVFWNAINHVLPILDTRRIDVTPPNGLTRADQTHTSTPLFGVCRSTPVIWGQRLDPSNFLRKVLGASGFVQPTGKQRLPPTGRPAALYRRGSAWLLSPPLLRGVG